MHWSARMRADTASAPAGAALRGDLGRHRDDDGRLRERHQLARQPEAAAGLVCAGAPALAPALKVGRRAAAAAGACLGGRLRRAGVVAGSSARRPAARGPRGAAAALPARRRRAHSAGALPRAPPGRAVAGART